MEEEHGDLGECRGNPEAPRAETKPATSRRAPCIVIDMLLSLLFACTAPADSGGPDSGGPDSAVDDTHLRSGHWGADDYELLVGDDGTAGIDAFCASGATDDARVVDGAIDWTLTWNAYFGYGVDTAGSGTATLVGSVAGDVLTTTLTLPDGEALDVVFTYGREVVIYNCA